MSSNDDLMCTHPVLTFGNFQNQPFVQAGGIITETEEECFDDINEEYLDLNLQTQLSKKINKIEQQIKDYRNCVYQKRLELKQKNGNKESFENVNRVQDTSYPGNLDIPEDKMYTNKFIPTDVLPIDMTLERKESFRKYIEDKRLNERIKNKNTDDLMSTNEFVPGNDSRNLTFAETRFDERYNKPRRTVVTIDSRDRNINAYPEPNHYKISLNRQFRNVKSINLISSEFPNTEQAIKSDPFELQNNNVFWLNDEDAGQDYNCLIYEAIIPSGNYSANTLESIMTTNMNVINRFSDNTSHEFIITIDLDTDICTIQSIQSVLLTLNPLSSEVGSSIIIVNQTNHGFNVGDSVVISGARQFAGISSVILNTTHIVISTTQNTYQIIIPAIANDTTIGGGSSVRSGQNRPFKLLFSNRNTLGEVLGFPQQDSSFHISYPITFIDTSPVDLTEIETVPATVYPVGTVPARFTSVNHRLVVGDIISIQDTNMIPNINGINTVTRVIDPDIFEIGKIIKLVNNQTIFNNTNLGQVIESLDPALIEITNINIREESFLSTTGHGVVLSDTIYIAYSDISVPNSINGINIVTDIIDANDFRISTNIETINTITGDEEYVRTIVAPNSITQLIPANNGIIVSDNLVPLNGDNIYIYNTTTTPSINGDQTIDKTSSNTFDILTPITSVTSTTGNYVTLSVTTTSLDILRIIPTLNCVISNISNGLTSGDKIYIANSTGTVSPSINGIRTVVDLDPVDADAFSIQTPFVNSTSGVGTTEYVVTTLSTPNTIQNIYPQNNGLLFSNHGQPIGSNTEVIFYNDYKIWDIKLLASPDPEIMSINQVYTTSAFDVTNVTITQPGWYILSSTLGATTVVTLSEYYLKDPVNPSKLHTFVIGDFVQVRYHDVIPDGIYEVLSTTPSTIELDVVTGANGGSFGDVLKPGEYIKIFTDGEIPGSDGTIGTIDRFRWVDTNGRLNIVFTDIPTNPLTIGEHIYIRGVPEITTGVYEIIGQNATFPQTVFISDTALAVPVMPTIFILTPTGEWIYSKDPSFTQVTDVSPQCNTLIETTNHGLTSFPVNVYFDDVITTSSINNTIFTLNYTLNDLDIISNNLFKIDSVVTSNVGPLVFAKWVTTSSTTIQVPSSITPGILGVIETTVPHGLPALPVEYAFFDGIDVGVTPNFENNIIQILTNLTPTTFEINQVITIGSGAVGKVVFTDNPVAYNISDIKRQSNGTFTSTLPHGIVSPATKTLYIANIPAPFDSTFKTINTIASQIGNSSTEFDTNQVLFTGSIAPIVYSSNEEYVEPLSLPVQFVPNELNIGSFEHSGIPLSVSDQVYLLINQTLEPTDMNGLQTISKILSPTEFSISPITNIIPTIDIINSATPNVINVNQSFQNGDSVTITGHTGSVPDINGTYIITNVTSTSFEIPVIITEAGIGGTVTNNTSIGRFFRTNTNTGASTINAITKNLNPAIITSANHELTGLYAYIFDTISVPNINGINTISNIIPEVSFEINETILEFNDQLIVSSKTGRWSKEIIETNVGPIENITSLDPVIIETNYRENPKKYIMYPIITSTIGNPAIITVPNHIFENDNKVTISGHRIIAPDNGSPYIDGEYTINNVVRSSFPIVSSIGNTINVPGHTYSNDDTIIIENHFSIPPINGIHIISNVIPGVSLDIDISTFGGSTGTISRGESFTIPVELFTSGIDGFVTGPTKPVYGHGLKSFTNTIIDIAKGFPSIITTSTNHDLLTNNEVELSNTNSVPSVDGIYIIEVLSDTTFSINKSVKVSGTSGTWFYGDKVVIKNLSSAPNINEQVFPVTVISPTEFSIPIKLDSVESYINSTWGSNILKVEYTDHGLITRDLAFMYNIQESGGIQQEYINTQHGDKRNNEITIEEKFTRKFIRRIDNNYFEIESTKLGITVPKLLCPDPRRLDFASIRSISGGYDICISSHNHTNVEKLLGLKNHGFDSIQTNVNCNGLLNRVISLEGEPYFLMVSNILDTVVNTGTVDRVFSKILLSDPPGSILYNSFITNAKTFEDPVPIVEELEFTMKRADNRLFNFNGIDHSFSLEIYEYVDRLKNSNVSSRRGIADRGEVSTLGFYESNEIVLQTPTNISGVEERNIINQQNNQQRNQERDTITRKPVAQNPQRKLGMRRNTNVKAVENEFSFRN